jgi:hypothetical protein
MRRRAAELEGLESREAAVQASQKALEGLKAALKEAQKEHEEAQQEWGKQHGVSFSWAAFGRLAMLELV